MTVSADIVRAVKVQLLELARGEDVRILYAVESGSRAWGFPSRDSDYDVRFVYARRHDFYLSVDVEHRRDVIERPIVGDMDVSGWDLRKALRLFAKSNPPLLEWLSSPIVYTESLGFPDALRQLIAVYYSPVATVHHYRHMAEGNFREYLRGDSVWLKKYLYVLRPLLALRWVEQARGPVPMEFARLYATIEEQPALVAAIQALVARKMAGDELDQGPRISIISDFAARELARLAAFAPAAPAPKPGFDPLNALFRDVVARAWAAP